jgi:hypothetical protein
VQDFEDFVLVKVFIDFKIVLHNKRNNEEEFQKSKSGDPTNPSILLNNTQPKPNI